MQKYNIVIKFIIILFAFTAILSSCVPIKKQIYLQSKEDSAKAVFVNDKYEDYRLQPGNNLHVQIRSIDRESYEFFNLEQTGNIYYDAAIYLNSYSVDDSGYVELPFLGKIYVNNLTVKEVKELFQSQIDKYLKMTMVIVKLVNYNVTMVGEVNRPGQYKVYQDKINIFEMIGIAGDLTVYAKRNDVVLVRKTEAGSQIYHIDLLDEDLLESELYYIMPDDLIYFRPVKGRNFAFSSFPYTLVISSISLGLALFAIFK